METTSSTQILKLTTIGFENVSVIFYAGLEDPFENKICTGDGVPYTYSGTGSGGGGGGGTTDTTPTDSGEQAGLVVSPTLLLTEISSHTFADLNALIAGTQFNFDVNPKAGSETGMVYSCKFEYASDSAVNPGQDCSALAGAATFNSSTGVLTWTPSARAVGANRIKITGTRGDASGSIFFSLQVRPALFTAWLVSYLDASLVDTAVPGSNALHPTKWRNLMGTGGASLDATLMNTIAFSSTSGWTGDGALQPVSTSDNTHGPYRLALDGANDAFRYSDSVATMNTLSSVTVEAWIRPLDVTTGTGGGKVIASNGQNGKGMSLRQSPFYAGKLELMLGDPDTKAYTGAISYTQVNGLEIGATTTAFYPWVGKIDEVAIYGTALSPARIQRLYEVGRKCLSSGTIAAHSWTHLSGVFDEPTHSIKLLINGVETCSQTLTSNSVIVGSNRDLRVGSDAGGTVGTFWRGSVAQMRIYGEALGSGDLLDNYNATAPIFQPAL